MLSRKVCRMKIESITLYNFGSYEGKTVFDTSVSEGRNIVLFGGKNGAGKTTLFTAMRLCLYGYMSMGYKNQNSYYYRAISKLINNNAKLQRPAYAHVIMKIALNNGHSLDEYILNRSWELSESLSEKFTVEKNDCLLNETETADFEKYILNLIPPELFNLYFFDGEKIADFFLTEGSNTRIKDAFLTLCGYDTFDIMRRNFKRISTSGGGNSEALSNYLQAKDNYKAESERYDELSQELNSCIDEIVGCEDDIKALEKDYYKSGGISLEEWNAKLEAIKDEEKMRETLNSFLKHCANNLVPFLMIRPQIVALKEQIIRENNNLKYRNFCEVIESPEIEAIISTNLDMLKHIAFKKFGHSSKAILNLSLEQSSLLLSQCNAILDFDINEILNAKKEIKSSLARSAKIRKELDTSSISNVQNYMKSRAELFEKKSILLVKRVELEQKLSVQAETVELAESHLSKIQLLLEDEIKKASINSISAKAIIMLDQLQTVLYRKQINKVESFFRNEIKTLMRKNHFIEDIHIDDSFNIHIYRTESLKVSKLVETLHTNSESQSITLLGDAAISKLKKMAKTDDIYGVIHYLRKCGTEEIWLPFEIDKMSLSNGEKQIFIMALYHSLIQLCEHEIPFVIDTPFARIDTEHRLNISKYFFSKLKGQVFILSTNEEINSSHVQIMRDKISATYMLENHDNKCTTVLKNSYFEV